MRVTGQREVTLTFTFSCAESDLWETFAAEHGLPVADVLHLAALSGLKYQTKSAGDEIKALIAERCELEALAFLGKPSHPGPGMSGAPISRGVEEQ